MRVDEFIQHMCRDPWRNPPPMLNVAPGDITWKDYKALAKLTEGIKFDCDFNEKGKCKAAKGRRRDAYWTNCCCDSCYGHTGFYKVLPNNYEDLSAIANVFRADDRSGFYEAGQGCRLPRELRSPTCLGHTCFSINLNKIELAHRILLRFFKYNENRIPESRMTYKNIQFHLDGYYDTCIALTQTGLRKIIGPVKWKRFWNKYGISQE